MRTTGQSAAGDGAVSRVLTAGAASPPAAIRLARDHDDPERDLLMWFEELCVLGWKHQTLLPRLQRLGKQLSDPTRRDQPGRNEADARYSRWRLDIFRIEFQAEAVQRGLARVWDRLPPGVKARQQHEPEWKGAKNGRDAAAAAWVYVRRQRHGPGDDCPFALLGIVAASLVLKAVTQ